MVWFNGKSWCCLVSCNILLCYTVLERGPAVPEVYTSIILICSVRNFISFEAYLILQNTNVSAAYLYSLTVNTVISKDMDNISKLSTWI